MLSTPSHCRIGLIVGVLVISFIPAPTAAADYYASKTIDFIM